MMGRIGRLLVGGLALAASSLAPARDFAPQPYQIEAMRSLLSERRNRRGGNPAGTKLARKARQGRVGLATIR